MLYVKYIIVKANKIPSGKIQNKLEQNFLAPFLLWKFKAVEHQHMKMMGQNTGYLNHFFPSCNMKTLQILKRSSSLWSSQTPG